MSLCPENQTTVHNYNRYWSIQGPHEFRPPPTGLGFSPVNEWVCIFCLKTRQESEDDYTSLITDFPQDPYFVNTNHMYTDSTPNESPIITDASIQDTGQGDEQDEQEDETTNDPGSRSRSRWRIGF